MTRGGLLLSSEGNEQQGETMRTVEAYQTSDGRLFLDDDKAAKHQTDIVGEMLDGLVANDSRGNVTRSDRFSILTKMLDDPQLKQKIAAIHAALQHGD